ncbi:MAG: 3-hydroxybutyryl-CoA dehydrogenase [Bradyrhizobium sp.]|jgi:3-hydroxybutyryl-CoA dehydrogenase
MKIGSIGVIGGGLMGAGIATRFALAGFDTILIEADARRMTQIPVIVNDILTELIDAEVCAPAQRQQAQQLLSVTSDLSALANAAIVIEAIPEVLEIKQTLYAQLELLLPADALIMSNTSGFLPDLLCEKMQHKQRFLIAHFWNPPHLIPLVEVVAASATTPDVIEKTMAVLREIKAEPVLLAKAIPGFIGNRLQFALLREALHIVRSGAADAATVDAVMTASLGRRYSIMGPLESADLGGLNTLLQIGTHLMPELANDQQPLELLREQVDQGDLGLSSGRGFYEWGEERTTSISARRRALLRRNRTA